MECKQLMSTKYTKSRRLTGQKVIKFSELLNRPTFRIDRKQKSEKWNKLTAVYARAYGIPNTHEYMASWGQCTVENFVILCFIQIFPPKKSQNKCYLPSNMFWTSKRSLWCIFVDMSYLVLKKIKIFDFQTKRCPLPMK